MVWRGLARSAVVRRAYKGTMRAVLLGALVLVVLAIARPAHAGVRIIVVNTGADIMHIRDLPPETAKETDYTAIGYRYDRFGVYWLDFWRWGGEFVVYNDRAYAPLSASQLAELGGA